MVSKRRISSFDENYISGALSVFPKAKDSWGTLYEASNEAITTLKHTLTPSSKYIVVENTEKFPFTGILKIESPFRKGEFEIIYYSAKVNNQFHGLQRGFAGHKTYTWMPGSNVSLPVMAEHHNALKDAILNIEKKIGLPNKPEKDSVLGMLKTLEDRWLNPKASFRAYPKNGNAPLTVKFNNISNGNITRVLWDFGDGHFSTEKNPIHTYEKKGNFTVKLSVVSDKETQGIVEKENYIIVNENELTVFAYSKKINNNQFEFIDLTPEENIIERYWLFGDGKEETIKGKYNHTIIHKYDRIGEYSPKLSIRLKNNKLIRFNLNNIVVEA